MDPTAGKQTIPISELGIEQLNMLQKQLDQELAFFTESLKELKKFEAKFAASESAIVESKSITADKEVLIPLTESMYISAQMEDPAKFMIDIGTGYFVEMSNEQAADYFKRKQQYLKKQMETIEKILPEKQQMRGEPLSICEKNFIISSFVENMRVDGRKCDEFRSIKVVLGAELGTCIAIIGHTK